MKKLKNALKACLPLIALAALAHAALILNGCHSGSPPQTGEVEGAIGTPKPVTTYYVHIHDEGHNYDYWARTSLPKSVGSNIWMFTNLFNPPRVITVVNPGTIYWEENQ